MIQCAAILGSGFGLYGYLPALIKCGAKEVLLPQRYREKFSVRQELQDFSNKIHWVADEKVALAQADGMVTALRPDMQAEYIALCLEAQHIKYLLLEKPLAPSPAEAITLFDALVASGKYVRIGYIFGFLAWSESLASFLKKEAPQTGTLTIHWHFMAHHFQNDVATWKRDHAAGGGVLRFYGIHLIALLAAMGYSEAVQSTLFTDRGDVASRWSATFTGASVPPCIVDVDTCTDTLLFQIEYSEAGRVTTLVDLPDPFSEMKVPEHGLDRRIPLLVKLCESFNVDSRHIYPWYRATLDLWSDVECMITSAR